MPRGGIKNFWPLANTHYYHGRLFFGNPRVSAAALGKKEIVDGEEVVDGVTDEDGSINIKDDANDNVGDVILIDPYAPQGTGNAVVVYPKLPKSPLETFAKSDSIMTTIREVALSKRFHGIFWAEMMLNYKTKYWKFLFGNEEDDAADQVFINFIKTNVSINHEREDDIKQAIIARYLSVKSNYEIGDLKAYLAYNPLEDEEEAPEEEGELLAADVSRSVAAVSEHVFSLEDDEL
jgi:hypothetical protein